MRQKCQQTIIIAISTVAPKLLSSWKWQQICTQIFVYILIIIILVPLIRYTEFANETKLILVHIVLQKWNCNLHQYTHTRTHISAHNTHHRRQLRENSVRSRDVFFFRSFFFCFLFAFHNFLRVDYIPTYEMVKHCCCCCLKFESNKMLINSHYDCTKNVCSFFFAVHSLILNPNEKLWYLLGWQKK